MLLVSVLSTFSFSLFSFCSSRVSWWRNYIDFIFILVVKCGLVDGLVGDYVYVIVT